MGNQNTLKLGDWSKPGNAFQNIVKATEILTEIRAGRQDYAIFMGNDVMPDSAAEITAILGELLQPLVACNLEPLVECFLNNQDKRKYFYLNDEVLNVTSQVCFGLEYHEVLTLVTKMHNLRRRLLSIVFYISVINRMSTYDMLMSTNRRSKYLLYIVRYLRYLWF